MDYYKILEVDRGADQETIKKAFKKKAMQHHPDKGGDEATFKKINEAFQILSDTSKKQNYDKFGTAGGEAFSGFNYKPYTGRTNTPFNVDDIFKSFGTHFRNNNSRVAKNKDVIIEYAISIKDIYHGKSETIEFRLPSGRSEVLDVNIPVGIRPGNKVKFSNIGDDSIRELPRGDIYLHLTLQPDNLFVLEGDDLHGTLHADIFDLIIGARYEIELPDKTTIEMTIPPGTNPGTMFSINGHGLPIRSTQKSGKIYMKVKCNIPRYSEAQRNRIKQLQEELDIVK